MTYSMNVHGADKLWVLVKEFRGFATVDLRDTDGNEITLFFSDVEHVREFAARIELAAEKAQESA